MPEQLARKENAAKTESVRFGRTGCAFKPSRAREYLSLGRPLAELVIAPAPR
jgi:hypothetical protein